MEIILTDGVTRADISCRPYGTLHFSRNLLKTLFPWHCISWKLQICYFAIDLNASVYLQGSVQFSVKEDQLPVMSSNSNKSVDSILIQGFHPSGTMHRRYHTDISAAWFIVLAQEITCWDGFSLIYKWCAICSTAFATLRLSSFQGICITVCISSCKTHFMDLESTLNKKKVSCQHKILYPQPLLYSQDIKIKQKKLIFSLKYLLCISLLIVAVYDNSPGQVTPLLLQSCVCGT
jgi:hypothetical protein